MNNGKDTRSRIEEAYVGIKKLMLQQKLVAGQKLLYRELIDMLHMSKTPIINALNRLEQEGFIISSPNYGYSVKPIDKKEIVDSQEVREALEIKAIEQAVALGKPSDFAILADKLRAYKDYRPFKYDRKKFVLNAEFHLNIVSISGNEVLKYLLKRNLEHVILRAELNDYSPDKMVESSRDHSEILRCLRQGDTSACIKLIRKHIQETRDELLRSFSGGTSEELENMSFFSEEYLL